MSVAPPVRALVTAAGAGALAGAGQLGLGYGLGLVRLNRTFSAPAPWHGQVTFVTFLASLAVIIGAAGGAWRARRLGVPVSPSLRVGFAGAALVGASVMLPLLLRPSNAAVLAEPGDPRLIMILAAVAGLVAGTLVALVLGIPVAAGNVVASATWVVAAALISAGATLGRGDAWAQARLGLLPIGGGWPRLALIAVPVMLGLAVAGLARFGGSRGVRLALCGLPGPALIAFAYLVAGPGGGSQASQYRLALTGMAAGVAVSAVVALARRPRQLRLLPAAATLLAGVRRPSQWPLQRTTTTDATEPLATLPVPESRRHAARTDTESDGSAEPGAIPRGRRGGQPDATSRHNAGLNGTSRWVDELDTADDRSVDTDATTQQPSGDETRPERARLFGLRRRDRVSKPTREAAPLNANVIGGRGRDAQTDQSTTADIDTPPRGRKTRKPSMSARGKGVQAADTAARGKGAQPASTGADGTHAPAASTMPRDTDLQAATPAIRGGEAAPASAAGAGTDGKRRRWRKGANKAATSAPEPTSASTSAAPSQRDEETKPRRPAERVRSARSPAPRKSAASSPPAAPGPSWPAPTATGRHYAAGEPEEDPGRRGEKAGKRGDKPGKREEKLPEPPVVPRATPGRAFLPSGRARVKQQREAELVDWVQALYGQKPAGTDSDDGQPTTDDD